MGRAYCNVWILCMCIGERGTVGNIIFRMDSGVGLGITHLYWWLVDGAGVAVQFVLLCFKEAAGKV
eukprot:scaffold29987_cov106-Skeletonema_marinoi.AAC.1